MIPSLPQKLKEFYCARKSYLAYTIAMKIHVLKRRRTQLVLAIGTACIVLIGWHFLRPSQATSPPKPANGETSATKKAEPAVSPQTPTPTVPTTPVFDKSKYSTTDASSLWVVVNKQHPLSPLGYTPTSLQSVGNGQRMRTDAAAAFSQMQSAAAAAGTPISATSGYRSYSYQVSVYNGYVAQYGVAQTDTFSARPGYSEHQTGLALDIQGGGCSLDNCFANTAQGKWLSANAYIYGFILRYPSDKTAITGYQYEAWHYRYVGTELATEMHRLGITTLEEFFGVSGGSVYN